MNGCQPCRLGFIREMPSDRNSYGRRHAPSHGGFPSASVLVSDFKDIKIGGHEFEETERGRASAAQSVLLWCTAGKMTIENSRLHLRRRSEQFPVSIFESRACSVTRATFDRLIAFSCVDLVLLFLAFLIDDRKRTSIEGYQLYCDLMKFTVFRAGCR
jgi:hypothetical protein